MSSPTQSGPVVGKEPEDARRVFLGREAAGDRQHRHDDEEPAAPHRDAQQRIVEGRTRGQAGKGGPVVRDGRAEGVEDLREAVRALVERPGQACRHHRGDHRAAQDQQRQDGDGQHGELHFAAFDLLADIFGRAADHQPGDEHREDGEEQEAVDARADAADDDFAKLHVDHRDHAAERGEAVMHRVDRAAGGSRGDAGEQRRGGDAEADFLALHIAARRRGASGARGCPRLPANRRRRCRRRR